MKERIACPVCPDSNVSLIPVAVDEQYRIRLGTSTGLKLSFSKRSK
jgi:adenosine deaminase